MNHLLVLIQELLSRLHCRWRDFLAYDDFKIKYRSTAIILLDLNCVYKYLRDDLKERHDDVSTSKTPSTRLKLEQAQVKQIPVHPPTSSLNNQAFLGMETSAWSTRTDRLGMKWPLIWLERWEDDAYHFFYSWIHCSWWLSIAIWSRDWLS